MTTEKLVMCQELREKLCEFGWDAELIEAKGVWGVRVSGSPHHITLRLSDGQVCYYSGPLVAIVAGGQAAIVR